MYKINIAYKLFFGICFFALGIQEQAKAQIVIGTPNLGFSQACANESFNTYSTTFVFSPESNLNASNQFSIELSDADGDFTNATIVFTSNPGAVNTSPATLVFSLPNTTSGENYKLRIKVVHLLQPVQNQYLFRHTIKYKTHHLLSITWYQLVLFVQVEAIY